MCGIAGWISADNISGKVAKVGLLGIEHRGKDATGYYTKYLDRKESFRKGPITASLFCEAYLPKRFGNVTILHTRAKTHGEPDDNNNNHPVVSENYTLVHNGVVNTTPRILDYNYKGQVDTEIIVSYLERKGLKEGLEEIRGSAAIAFMDKRENDCLYLYRRRNPIELALVGEETLLFASTEDALEDMVKAISPTKHLGLFLRCYRTELPEGYLYKFVVKDGLVKVESTTKITEKWQPRQRIINWTNPNKSWGFDKSWYNFNLPQSNTQNQQISIKPTQKDKVDSISKLNRLYNLIKGGKS